MILTQAHIDDGTISPVNPLTFVTEASTLRLAPGEFPRTIKTDLGNGLPFQRTGWARDAGARYRQMFGALLLTVAND